jgi:hypothetical protein
MVSPSVRNTMEMTLNAWFSIFFTKNMINNIVRYTNQYAIYCGNDRWTKLIVREFEVWLGLTITMEIYQIIKSHLYFSNPGETHMYQLGKVRIFFNQFRTQCRKQFHPPRMMSIDEMMIKTKSKFTKYKIRNLKKLIRDGIKIEALCDSQTGYLYTFHVHTSSNEDLFKLDQKQ